MMTIRIDGKTEIGNATVRIGGDGGLLTIVIRNSPKTVNEIAALLGGKPKIELISGGFVTAVYQGMRLRSCRMEVIGGVTMVNVSMQVDRIHADTAVMLEKAMKHHEETVRKQAETIAQQAEVIRRQEESLEEMASAVREAQRQASLAADALAAIEGGMADV